MTGTRSKTLATWSALLGGAFGLHRFYLYGKRDLLGWLLPVPTLLGLYGVLRAREIGLDDQWSWVLMPLLGLVLAGTMLTAIVYGLTSDEKWNARFNPQSNATRSGWPVIIGVLLALSLGATVLMATIAFGAQRYFEFQAEPPVAIQAGTKHLRSCAEKA
jgi:hypothetical protein